MHHPSNLITTLVFAAAITLAGCGGKSHEEHVKSAKLAMQTADYMAATLELKNALQKTPNDIELRLMLGQAYQALELWADSDKELKKALELGASPEQILPRLAHSLVRQGKYKEVLDLIQPQVGLGSQALASLQAERANAQMALNKPDEAALAIAEGEKAIANLGLAAPPKDLQLAKARLAITNKQPADALAILDALLKTDSKYLDALYLKAYLLLTENKRVEAIKLYQQVLDIDPKQWRAHLASADLYLNDGNVDAADASVLAAAKLVPTNLSVQFYRATIEFRRGKINAANEAVLQVLRLAPEHTPSRLLAAAISYSLGKYEQSQKDAEYALAHMPGNVHAVRIIAASQLKLNNPKGALKTLALIQGSHGDDAALLTLKGEAYLQAGDYAKAMDYLDRAANLSPKSAYIKTQQATGHLVSGHADRAIADLENASALSGSPGQADMLLILLHVGQRNYDKALQAIASYEKKLPNNPVIHNLRALVYLGKKDFVSARKSLQQALAIDPTFFPAAASLARLDIQERKPESARARFEALLEKDKGNVQAMLALAELAAANGQQQDHVAWLEKAVKAQPSAIPPRAALIAYYLGKKETEKALGIAREVLSNNQDNPEAIRLLGNTQMALGDTSGAVVTFNSLVRKTDDSPDAYLQLGLAQVANKQLAAARSSLEKAVQIKPDHIQVKDALLRLALLENDPGAALLIARQIQAQQPKSGLGFDREGDLLMFQKRPGLAIKFYEQALKLDDEPDILVKLHRAMLLAGDAKGAEQKLKNWMLTHPEDQNMRAYMAGQYLAAKRNREAIAVYEEILRNSPNSVLALNNLAVLYLREKDGRALATAEQAMKLAPQNQTVRYTIGMILLEQGQVARALDVLREAVAKAPKSGSAHYNYALALERSGKKAEAKKELETALSSGDKFPEQAAARAMFKRL